MPILIWFILLSDKLLGRKPLSRGLDEQAVVDKETASFRLYHFASCPFCRKVRRDIGLLSLRIDSADIKRDPRALHELIGGGGKKQVPCLRIEQGGAARWLYESGAITRYLRERFA